ncbi:putative flavonoid 3-hydroxylase [Annulohypoxylon bovei var. microspora]|nr:putative flavonoid 3-hydroxylase [Annulohypoxylon bovei var. microspora]
MAFDTRWLFLSLATVLYPLVLAIYRIYFHPLAKFPGPKLAAATGWYETYIDLFAIPRGNFMEEITRMHDKYGPVIRINPHEIHVRDSTWLDTLYRGHRDKYPPTAYMTGTPKGTAAQMIYDHAELLLRRMDDQILRDGSAEMRTNYLALATDNVADYFTGQPRGLLRNEKRASEWRTSIRTLAEWTLIGRHFSWVFDLVLKLPLWPLELFLPDIGRIAGLHRIYSQQSQLHEKPTERRDIFQTILRNENLPTTEKAFDRISHEGVVTIAAGGETTARALTIATYFLLAEKNTILPMLQEEIEAVMPSPSSRPSIQELERLPWLTAVIKESLRVMGLPTTRFPLVSPNEPLRYKNWVIPAGTPISMTIRDVLLDAEVFDDALEFRPERWLSPNADLDRLNRCFVPFGRGNRMCAGVNLAYAELYIVLASLFCRRKLELYDTIKERDIDIVRDCFIGETSPNTKGVRVRYT